MLGEHIGAMLFPKAPRVDPRHCEPRCFFTGDHMAYDKAGQPSVTPSVSTGAQICANPGA